MRYNIPAPNEPIEVDSLFAKKVGMTSDKFAQECILFWDNSTKTTTINFMYIEKYNRGKGYFSELVKNLEKISKRIVIICPTGIMQKIMKPKGYGPISRSKSKDLENSVWHKIVMS